MSKKKVEEKVANARNHISSMGLYYSATKIRVLNLTVDYAKNHFGKELIGIKFLRNENRYVIYSNIINLAYRFKDDIHFLAYVMQELEKIPACDDSKFRDKVLPYAHENLNLLLIPEITKMRKSFAGLMAGSVIFLLVDFRVTAFLFTIGIAGYLFSKQIVHERLKASLQIKMHQLLVGDAAHDLVLTDGFEDIVGRFTNTSMSILDSSMTLFAHAGEKFRDFAHSKQTSSVTTRRIEMASDRRPQLTLFNGPTVPSIATQYSMQPYSIHSIPDSHATQTNYAPIVASAPPPIEYEVASAATDTQSNGYQAPSW